MSDPGTTAPTVAAPPLVSVVLVDVRAERMGVMRVLLESSGLVVVMGEADSAAAAVEEVGRTCADVVVVEIQMPVEVGLETVAVLRQHFPRLGILVCSFHQTERTQRLALDNGADGYLNKPVDVASLREQLQHIASARPVLQGDRVPTA